MTLHTPTATTRPMWLNGRAASPSARGHAAAPVHDKWTGEEVARVPQADRETIERAIAGALDAAPAMRELAAWERRDILLQIVNALRERADDFIDTLIVEAGKTITDARGEHARAVETFQAAAGEAMRLDGEYLPLDVNAKARGLQGIVKRFPLGPCSFICPFNFPLNLVAHKIAPAIAAGCPFVLKPAHQAPLSALLLGEVLAGTDLPAEAFSILPCEVKNAAPLVEDERPKLLSFTGSAKVGWMLKSRAGRKRVVLELGGNAACIVDADADLDTAADRLITGGFAYAGQSCISVQRIIIHDDRYDALRDVLVERAAALPAGDPRDERTVRCPMISEDDARRAESWITEAVDAGATRLCGGGRDGTFLEPTVLEHVPRDATIYREEAFSPVVLLERFTDFTDACDRVNDSRYGLQTGVFTNTLSHAFAAFDRLDVGGVVINHVPSFRVDPMPYGGVKESGFGREGLRYAIEDMTEPRLLLLYDVASGR